MGSGSSTFGEESEEIQTVFCGRHSPGGGWASHPQRGRDSEAGKVQSGWEEIKGEGEWGTEPGSPLIPEPKPGDRKNSSCFNNCKGKTTQHPQVAFLFSTHYVTFAERVPEKHRLLQCL